MTILTVAELRSYLGIEETTTFTASAATDLLTLASVPFMNTLTTGTEVTLTNSEAVADLPEPLAEDTIYYVHTIVDQTCALATTSANASAGVKINITDAGTGTHTITRSNAQTTLLQEAIDDALAHIQNETHRVFEAAAGTRYYNRSALDRYDSTILHLDGDLVTVTTLTNGDASGTEIAADYYWLLDRNLGPPYHAIQLTVNDGYYWEFDTDYWVSVEGTWGYSATAPADVKRALTRLAAFFYRQKDSQVFDTTAIPDAGVITMPAGLEHTMQKLITKYRKYI